MTEQTPTYVKGSPYQIPRADLQADPSQPGTYFDPATHQDLVDSFQQRGVLQTRLTSELGKIKTFMTDIDLEKLDAAARKDLSSLLGELKKAADGLLKQIKSAPTINTPPVAKSKPKKEPSKKKPAATIGKAMAKNS